MRPYIDVRGCWPTLVKGQYAVTLRGCDRSITVEEAEKHLLLTSSLRVEEISTDLLLTCSTESH